VWSFGALRIRASRRRGRNIYLTDANGGLTSSPVAVPDPTHQAQPWNVAFTLTVREIATGLVSETSIVHALTDTYLLRCGEYDSLVPVVLRSSVHLRGRASGRYNAADSSRHCRGRTLDIRRATPASVTWWVNGIAIYTDAPAYYRVYNVIANAATLMPGFQVLAINVYRGKHGVWGSLGSVEVGTGEYQFADIGDTPNYAQQPPTGTDPFAIYDVSGAITGHDYPACVTHFQQRRVFARQGLHLGRIQASKPGQLNDFDVTDIVQDSDAINFDLSSQAIEDIRSLISSRALIALTSTGATVIRGAGSQRGGSTAITPASIDATKQGTRGAAWTDPVMVDNTILFAGAKGSEVRAMTYDPYLRSAQERSGANIGIVAQHFLRGHSIVDMTFQETPDSIVWLVRDDGLLLGLTFIPAQQPEDAIHGWHQHPTNGTVQRVAVVQEGLDDVLYLVTQRAGAFLIERMASRNVPNDDVRFAVFLDASG
jgi:hypothetical protein